MTSDNKNMNSISVAELLAEDEWFDLLPVEKKLITWSLATGIVLLVFFTFVFVVLK